MDGARYLDRHLLEKGEPVQRPCPELGEQLLVRQLPHQRCTAYAHQHLRRTHGQRAGRLDVGSDTPVKLGGGNRAGHVSQHPKADRFRSHVRARVDAHKNADGDNLDDLRSADETIRSSIPVKTIREDATSHSVSIADQCGESHANTEYWGDVVEEGTVGLIRTPEECCRRCAGDNGLQRLGTLRRR